MILYAILVVVEIAATIGISAFLCMALLAYIGFAMPLTVGLSLAAAGICLVVAIILYFVTTSIYISAIRGS